MALNIKVFNGIGSLRGGIADLPGGVLSAIRLIVSVHIPPTPAGMNSHLNSTPSYHSPKIPLSQQRFPTPRLSY